MSGRKIKGENKIAMIPVFQISVNKSQPRKVFNRDDIRYLARSIELNGILQPLTVRDISPFEYELISGERRLRAAVMAGFSFVPCLVVHCTEKQSAVYGLIENLQREDLNCFEQADAVNILMNDFNFSVEKAARQLGKSEAQILNKLKLLKFSPEERKMLLENNLSEYHALSILKIRDNNIRRKIMLQVIESNLNIIQTDELVRKIIEPDDDSKNQKHKIVIKDIRLFYNTIDKAVSTMRQSGINATEEKTETDDFVEYRIRITK